MGSIAICLELLYNNKGITNCLITNNNLYFYIFLTNNQNQMEALQMSEIRVHLKGGHSYVCPEINKNLVIKQLGDALARVEHYRPVQAAPPPPREIPTPPPPVDKRAALLGDLLVDDKITAAKLIGWIEKCTSITDLAIVMEDETRATVKTAYKERINNLI